MPLVCENTYPMMDDDDKTSSPFNIPASYQSDTPKEWVKVSMQRPYKITENLTLTKIEYCQYGMLYDFSGIDEHDKYEHHEDRWLLKSANSGFNDVERTFSEDYTYLDVWKAFQHHIQLIAELNNVELKKAKSEFLKQTPKDGIVYTSAKTLLCKSKAKEIYEAGNALDYIVECCGKQHYGNTHIIKSMVLSYANTRVLNSACNINIAVFSAAHAGKTHVKDTVKKYLPENVVDDSSKSDKALFYDEALEPGTILVQDDESLTEEKQNMLKNLKPNESHIHKTVRQQTPLITEIPERCPYWNLKVELQGDEQLTDRQLNLWCDDETPEYMEKRRAKQNELWGDGAVDDYSSDMKTCRYIWDLIKPARVTILFCDRIKGNLDQPRTYNLFIQMLCACALLNAPVREKDENGSVIADTKDFEIAASIMNPLLANKTGSQINGLSKQQKQILEYLETQPSGSYSYKMLMAATNLSQSALSKALMGYNAYSIDGLLKICPAISSVDMRTHDSESGADKSRKGIDWNKEAYLRWKTGYDIFTLDED